MKQTVFDFSDVLLAVGVLLLGFALYQLAGWPAVLGFVGVIVMRLALVAGRRA